MVKFKFLLMALCLALVLVASVFADKAGQDEEWPVFDFRGDIYYFMPDSVKLELGLNVSNLTDDQNAAFYLLRACQIYIRYPGEWEDIDEFSKRSWTADERPDIAENIEANRAGLELLERAFSLDDCKFPVIVKEPGDRILSATLLPHLVFTRAYARLFALRSNLHAGEGRLDESVDDIRRIIDLGHLASREEQMISVLVGCACMEIALNSLRAALSQGVYPDEMLFDIQEMLLEAGNSHTDPVIGLRGEKRVSLNLFDHLFYDDLGLWEFFGKEYPPRKASDSLNAFLEGRLFLIVAPDRTMRADLEKLFDNFIEMAEKPPWEVSLEEEYRSNIRYYDFVSIYLGAIIPNYVDTVAESRALLDAAAQSVAILRYHADHGEYPDDLDALVPDYMPELPFDPFTGERFIFLANERGFRIYSVGMNRRDGGGSPMSDVVFEITAN